MSSAVYDISLGRLALSLIPVLVVVIIYIRWSLPEKTVLYASLRMLVQLILIGYFLSFIFSLNHPMGALSVLLAMTLSASWISLRPVAHLRKQLLVKAWFAIAFGGVSILILVVAGILRLDPWYESHYLIPLAGMVFAQCMNGVSLAVDRFSSDLKKGSDERLAKQDALKTALLPMTNAFFAVGLVSLPGMMTGQILAGVSPLIAVRYQIMVMGMIFGAIGIAATLFLTLLHARDVLQLKEEVK